MEEVKYAKHKNIIIYDHMMERFFYVGQNGKVLVLADILAY